MFYGAICAPFLFKHSMLPGHLVTLFQDLQAEAAEAPDGRAGVWHQPVDGPGDVEVRGAHRQGGAAHRVQGEHLPTWSQMAKTGHRWQQLVTDG